MNYDIEAIVSKTKLAEILGNIRKVKVGVLGDVSIDIYWEADMTLSELSRETPHFPLPVVRERMSPGAGGNVAVNLKELCVGNVYLVSLIGNDWRGNLLYKLLEDYRINLDGLVVSSNNITPAYCKPLRRGLSDVVYEDPRLDFENHSPVSAADELQIINQLNIMAENVDVITVCDQYKHGIITDSVINRLAELSLQGKMIVADSRYRIASFKHMLIKPNEVEAVQALYPDRNPLNLTESDFLEVGKALMEKTHKPLIITRGDKGAIWFENDLWKNITPVKVDPPIDIVGAGDTFNAAFCAAYGTGIDGDQAVAFGNIASSITIKKLGTTGTATPDEILQGCASQ